MQCVNTIPPMVNVIPLNDEREHQHTADCWCGPESRWQDKDTGEIYANGPIIIHNASDHREAVERLLGEAISKDKTWGVYAD